MKKSILSAIIVFPLLLAGCDKSATSSTENQSIALSQQDITSASESSTLSTNEWHDIYQITNDHPVFTMIINNNDIDKDYQYDMEGATTNADWISIENKYLCIWQTELENAVEKYAEVLLPDDKTQFLQLQQDWENSTVDNLNFENKVLTNDRYGIEKGSAYNYLRISEKREAFRQRTIRVKYLHYLFEIAVPNPKPIDECLSLKFVYDEKS